MDTDATTTFAKLPAKPRESRVPRVLFVTPEMSGYLKAGGLGEVAASLPLAMRAIADVRVLMPGYPGVFRAHPDMPAIRRLEATAALPAWTLRKGRTAEGLTLYIVDCPELYCREGTPYGLPGGADFADNNLRFARLSLAAAEIASGEADPDWRPTILHANDWPSALSLAYARWKKVEARTILTIHNLAYQGLCEPDVMDDLAIPRDAYRVDGVEFHGKISFLKAGIFYASHVTTVSETYAKEITTHEMGCGLDGLLRTRAEEGALTGIVNGIDASWDAGETNGNWAALQKWKKAHAEEIRRHFQLSASAGPLFSIISRLVHQKGIDLSILAAETIVRNGGQLVVTGRGEPRFEHAIESLAARHKGQIAANIGFCDKQARQIFAASDFLLMPSRFEPCGLSQMYAQKSGALPIAFRTGGLADTIEDGRTGFLFSTLNIGELAGAVTRAMNVFRSKPIIRRMRQYASAKRFDWGDSARAYLSLYRVGGG